MEATAIRIPAGTRWVYLCGLAAGAQATDVVVRAFESPALLAIGEDAGAPDSEPVLVPVGQGRRVIGRHVFARSASADRPSLVTFRGM